MDSYLVSAKGFRKEVFLNLKREEIPSYWEEHLFQPLEELIAGELKGELLIVNKMPFIGVALVEASENAVKRMRELDFLVSLNSKVPAI